MKNYSVRFVLLVSFLAIFSISALSQVSSPRLSDLDWLAGCWEMNSEKKGMQISEMWMRPAGDAMIGVGRTLKAGKLVDFEFLRIIETASGLAYVSRPSGNKEDTQFPLKTFAANAVVFENPTHDFPQRILYKRSGNKMTARIEGTRDGKTQGIDFPYTRASCESNGN
jgi:hypothetical protein